MSKMNSHNPFGHLKHKLWPKEGQESNWQFDSWPLKVTNCPNFLACRWRAIYHWKDLNKGYNFALNFILIEGLHTKLWAPKVAGVQTLGAGPMARHKVYYKGEGGGFSQVWALVSLVSSCLLVTRSCTKSAPAMHEPTCCLVCGGSCE